MFLTAAADKATLRARMQSVRSELPSCVRSGQALTRFAGHPLFASATVVAGYFAIRDELDPLPLMLALNANGHPLALPVVVAPDQPLVWRSWAPGDALATVKWGLREPRGSQSVAMPDILLVPLLAADRRGHRLGYGGGFYDRSIAAMRRAGSVVAVGLACDEQIIDAVPHIAYDECLDWLITPSGPMKCSGAA